MSAHEHVNSVPALLRIVAALLCALFLLDSVAYAGHLHTPAATATVTAEVHGMKCSLCTAFLGLIDAPPASSVPRPALATMAVVALPKTLAPTRRLRLVALPRGPPAYQPDAEPYVT